jgi:pentatricopeptide repeat protein
MLSKMKAFTFVRDKGFGTCLKKYKGDLRLTNGTYTPFVNSFCSAAVLPEVNQSTINSESPELPNWVKSSDNTKTNEQDDDFVLPSISYWIKNQKLNPEKTAGGFVDNDVEKVTKILRGKFESPDHFVQELGKCGVIVSESLVGQMLKRFSKEWKPAFGFFKWAKSQTSYVHSPDSYNMMVDILGRSRMFDLMWEVVEEMNKLENYITLTTMSKVLRRLAKDRGYEESIDAFKRIEHFGVKKDVTALNVLIDALVKDNNIEIAQQTYLEFKNQIAPNLQTFNILLHGWYKTKQLDKAELTIEEMKEYGFSPDVVSYTSLVDFYCHDKRFRDVEKVLDEMKEKGCNPGLVTYTIYMHALGKAKEINEALKVYEKVKEIGIVLDAHFYSSLIYILSKAGRSNDARQVFDDMPKQGTEPNLLAYNTIISVASKQNEEERALMLLKQMEEKGCNPNTDTYVPLLKMCCRLKRLKVITFLLNHMVKTNVGVGRETYSILIYGLCKSEKLENACHYFEETVAKGFVPWDGVYKLLVKELGDKYMAKQKERIEELMAQAKPQRSDHISDVLV